MDIDEVFKTVVGEFGVFQVVVFASLAALQIPLGFHMIQSVITAAAPNFRCTSVHNNVNTFGELNVCPMSMLDDDCGSVQYNANTSDSDMFTSIVSEWDLVCKESYKASLLQSLFMGGVLIGALTFGPLTDRYGRQKSIALSLIGLACFTICSSFASSYLMYISLRMVSGLFCGGTILVSFVLATEVCGASKRAVCGLIMPIMFACGIICYAGLAYVIRDWRSLSLATSTPLLLTIIFYWYIPESPRWLLAQGRRHAAEQVLSVIGMKNGVSRSSLAKIELREPSTAKTKTKTYTVIDLLKYRNMRKRTLLMIYGWFVNSAVYYGLTMSAGSIGSNRYISIALSGAVEIPAYVISLFLVDRLGRRATYCGCLIVVGFGCLSVLFTPQYFTSVITSLLLVSKLCIAASFAVVYVYAAELYPTVIRSNAMSMCSMAARIGGIVAPMILPLGYIYPSLQFTVFGSLALSAGIISLRLPETFGQPMPETVADVEESRQVLEKSSWELVDQAKVRLLEEEIEKSECDD